MINALWIAGWSQGSMQNIMRLPALWPGWGAFYLGNIYGSANAAQKWNLNVKETFAIEFISPSNLTFREILIGFREKLSFSLFDDLSVLSKLGESLKR